MYSIGIDLGGTNIAAGIVSEEGKILIKKSVPTFREREYKLIIKDMANLCLDLINEGNLSLEDITSIGLGSPGTINNDKGIIEYANNLKFKDVPVVEELNKYINKPIFIGNDANVAAYGEFESGAGSIFNDLVAVTLGTGVGGGIIVNGKMLTGSFNGGAELGHIVIDANGPKCTCGRKGCWEQYSSATSLIRDAVEAAKLNKDSLLNKLVDNDLNKMNAKIPFDAAQAGDEVAKKVIDNYVEMLSIGLANVINIFQPEVIVLGGGVSYQRENLIIPLKERVKDKVYGGADAFKTEIKVAELGNDAGIIGAALLYKLYE